MKRRKRCEYHTVTSCMFRKMKIGLFLSLFAFSQIQAENLFAQSRTISISVNNEPVEQVIEKIEKNSDYVFLYNDKSIDLSRRVSVKVNGGTINAVLDEMFKGTGIKYTISNRQIILSHVTVAHAGKMAGSAELSAVQDGKISVSGTIVDEKGVPVIGANIAQKGTTNGTISDFDGNFTIKVPKGSELLVSYVGYVPQTVKATGAVLKIILKEDAKVLGEVVVTAMGIQRKEETLTYATQTVGGNELTRAKEANLINSLQGKSAGLVITPNSGGAGGASKILLRGNASIMGNNSPLIVIDGVPMRNDVSGQMDMDTGGAAMIAGGSEEGSDALSQLNPDDIESITVLKGANSAALYGSAASNGVLMITTKKGREGALRIDVSSSSTFETPLVLPKLQNVYGSIIEGNVANGFSINGSSWGGKLSDMTADQLNPQNSVQRLMNRAYDVADFFQVGTNFNNTVALSGGTKNVQSYFSYGNTTANGIVPTNKYHRHNISFRENFSFFKDRLKINISGSYINQKNKNRPTGGIELSPLYNLYTAARNVDMNYYRKNYADYGATWMSNPYDIIVKVQDPNNPDKMISAIESGVTTELKDPQNGKQVWFMQDATKRNNPWWLLHRVTSEIVTNRVFGSVGADYKIIDGLNLQARVKYDYGEEQRENRQYATTMLPDAMNDRGRLIWKRTTGHDFYGDFMLSFNRDIKDFNLAINAGGSMMNSTSNYWKLTPSASAGGVYQVDNSCNQFILDNIFIKGGGSESDVTRGGLATDNWERAIFATAQLTYQDKATIEGSYREDWYRAFTQFKDMKPHFPYYSVGANAVLTNIFEMPRQFDELKVRASYSEVGNSIPNSLFLNSAKRNPATGAYIMSSTTEFKNPKPETTGSFEAGFDLSLFGRSFNIEATYYHAVMRNQFMYYNGGGGKTVYVNGGKVRNQGIELSASYILAPNNNFSWKTGINFSFNKNKILSTAKKADGNDLKYEVDMGNSSGLKVKFITGGSYGDLYGVDFMKDEEGKIIVNPKNGQPFKEEGQANKYLGNMNAKYNLGWHNTFNYKDFQFYFLIDGKIGGKVISFTEAYLDYYGVSERSAESRLNAERNNLLFTNKSGETSLGMLLPDGQMVAVEGYYTKTGGANPLGTNYVYNGTNFRLREISAGYTFRNLFGATKHLTVSVNARNLFFIYKDAPIDPETSLTTQNALGNVDIFSMPTTRSFGVSIKATF